MLREHQGTVGSVAFVPGTPKLISAGADGRLLAWDAEHGRIVAELHGHGADVSAVATSPDGAEIATGAVVLAMGVSYRRLGIPALDELVGQGVFYGASASEAERFTGRSVFVVGAGNSAGQAAVHLAAHARKVTILLRRTTLAETMSHYLIDEIEGRLNVDVRYRTEIVDASGETGLESLTLHDSARGLTETVPADAYYFRAITLFEVAPGPHDWLSRHVFIGVGERLETGNRVRYFKVT